MGKYRSSAVKRGADKKREPHYAWRGIGCLMLLIVPVISVAAGFETINYGLKHGWPIPFQLLGMPVLPDFFYKSTGLMILLTPIVRTPHFYAYAVTSLMYMVLLGGIMSVVYAFAYRMATPSRYGPLDAPPPNIKVKRYKR